MNFSNENSILMNFCVTVMTCLNLCNNGIYRNLLVSLKSQYQRPVETEENINLSFMQQQRQFFSKINITIKFEIEVLETHLYIKKHCNVCIVNIHQTMFVQEGFSIVYDNKDRPILVPVVTYVYSQRCRLLSEVDIMICRK